MLQHVALCFHVLRRVAARCSVRQFVAGGRVCFNVLQCVAICQTYDTQRLPPVSFHVCLLVCLFSSVSFHVSLSMCLFSFHVFFSPPVSFHVSLFMCVFSCVSFVFVCVFSCVSVLFMFCFFSSVSFHVCLFMCLFLCLGIASPCCCSFKCK